MKNLKTHSLQSDSFRNMTNLSWHSFFKKDDPSEFDIVLDDLLKKETQDWDAYPILLPRNGRFWDNGYEDID